MGGYFGLVSCLSSEIVLTSTDVSVGKTESAPEWHFKDLAKAGVFDYLK